METNILLYFDETENMMCAWDAERDVKIFSNTSADCLRIMADRLDSDEELFETLEDEYEN